MKRILIFLIITLLVGMFIYRIAVPKKEKKEKEKMVGIPVEVQIVKRGSIRETLSISGTIKSENEINVVTKIGGKVKEVYFKEGDYVKKGQLLIKLEDDEILAQLNQVKAAYDIAKTRLQLAQTGARPQERKQVNNVVDMAKAGLNVAEANYNRMKNLYESKAISKQQFETVEMQYKLAKAQYDSALQGQSMVDEGARKEDKEAAEAGVKQASAAVAYAKTMLKNTNIYAPSDGTVFMRMVDKGEMAAPGYPLLIIVDNLKLNLEVEVGEKEIKEIKKGNKVSIFSDAYPDRRFTGIISSLVSAINPISRTFKVKISISDKEGLIKSGMFARAKIEIRKHENIVLVPREAIQERRGKKVIFTVKDNKAVLKEVELGINDEKNYEIKEGIKEGEKIVVVGQTNLDEGVLVEMIK